MNLIKIPFFGTISSAFGVAPGQVDFVRLVAANDSWCALGKYSSMSL